MELLVIGIIVAVIYFATQDNKPKSPTRTPEAAAEREARLQRHRERERAAREQRRAELEQRVREAAEADLAAEAAARADGTLVTSFAAAETAMARAMTRYLGFQHAVCTPPGADAGIDITASGAVAQVKYYPSGKKVSRPEIQQLLGASAAADGVAVLFFAYGADPYAKPAVTFADEHDVALFSYDSTGMISAVNETAQRMPIRDGEARAKADAVWRARQELKDDRFKNPRTGSPCPCGGKFVSRKRRHDGRRFLGCSNFPLCTQTRPYRR